MELITRTHTHFGPSVIATHLRTIGMITVAVALHVPSQVKTWLRPFLTVPKSSFMLQRMRDGTTHLLWCSCDPWTLAIKVD